MRTLKAVSFAVCTVLIASAQDRAGNQIFQIPPGWNRTDAPASTVLSPGSESKESVALLLVGRPFAGDFRAAFDRDVQAMNGNLRQVRMGEVQSRHTAQGVELLAVTVELEGSNRSRPARYYLAANVQGRYEMIVYLTASPVLFKRYWPAVEQFAATWSFANLTGPASPPAETPTSPPPASAAPPAPPVQDVPPNRLDGVYSGYKYNYVTVLGVVQRKAVADYFSFFPNGLVYWGFLETGLAGFDPARACRGRPAFCGTYQVNGQQVMILLNRGTYRQAGSIVSGGLQIEDRKYTLQGDPAKSAAHALEGDFGRADARPGEDLARRFIRFTRDGRFVDQGIVTTITSADISTGNPRFERASGAGTYRLAPYTLILRYSDGYQRQLGVTIEPSDMDQPTLSRIFVNTYTLQRRR